MYSTLKHQDPEVYGSVERELHRQQTQIELIASENFVSKAVLEAQGSILTNKYAEGYPGKRYYGGCVHVDEAEDLARSRARELFSCDYVNVQPHSGSQANQGVFLALLKPGETILGMDLNSGGHLTHGARPNLSGKWFNPVFYGVNPETYLIDYDMVRDQAKAHQPKIIIAGGSAYPREIDFKLFREIADEVGAYLLVDQAHFAGLVAAGAYPSPLPYAHVVTNTTHKTLRGPRGGMIMSQTNDLEAKLNSAMFPGLQGGPLMHVIAAKAVCFGEALKPSFKEYGHQVVKNAHAMAAQLQEREISVITGGTDCHLLLVDLRGQGRTGAEVEHALEDLGLTCNKNGIPFDPLPPTQTSGIRVGTPAMTTRGFKEDEFKQVANWIADVIHSPNMPEGDQKKIKEGVRDLSLKYPLEGI